MNAALPHVSSDSIAKAEKLFAALFAPSVANSVPAVKACHVSFDKVASGAIERHAKRHKVAPATLVAMCMTMLLDDEPRLDRVMAKAKMPVRRAKSADGLTLLQQAMIYTIALHSGPDGVAKLSVNHLATLCGSSSKRASVRSGLDGLERDGLMERYSVTLRGRRQFHHSLTDSGWHIARRLAGEFGAKAVLA